MDKRTRVRGPLSPMTIKCNPFPSVTQQINVNFLTDIYTMLVAMKQITVATAVQG